MIYAPADSRKRKTLEKRIIYKLGTPSGINNQLYFI